MARRNDHSREEIREMALTAAERIVREEGYAGLSARKIAKPIGYTVGTLYLVFKNLDDLILQVNGRTLDDIHEAMKRAYASCREPQACVMALGRTYIAFATEDPHRWGMIFEHQLPDGENWPDWFAQKVARNFALVEQALRPIAKHRSATEIRQAARALWGGVHGICILALTNKLDVADLDSVKGLAESLISNYLQGFMKMDARHRAASTSK